ncbi:hypothetical protein M1349_04930 [Patescibacteria group bacterium]|nr:hypothetical protein [Patescibacteria group bacterium]
MPTKRKAKKSVKAKTKAKVTKGKLYLAAIVIAILAGLVLIFTVFSNPVKSQANVYSTDFENFNLGSVGGQYGWIVNGQIDEEEVTPQLSFGNFGLKSFRISNAIRTQGSNVVSSPLQDEAGESEAENASLSAGVRQPHFEVEWDFASANPEGVQQNLAIEANMDRGDANPMSTITIRDVAAGSILIGSRYVQVPDGLLVLLDEYKTDLVCVGSGGTYSNCSDVRIVPVAVGLSRNISHHIKATIDFVDGSNNDVVTVCVDNLSCYTGNSLEDMYRLGLGTPQLPKTVDSVLFRSSGGTVGGILGKGFYFDNFSIISSNPGAPTSAPTLTPVPENYNPKDDCEGEGWRDFESPSFKNQGDCVSYMRHIRNGETSFKSFLLKNPSRRSHSN